MWWKSGLHVNGTLCKVELRDFIGSRSFGRSAAFSLWSLHSLLDIFPSLTYFTCIPERIFADTNLFLRYLTNDVPECADMETADAGCCKILRDSDKNVLPGARGAAFPCDLWAI